jgi:ATP-dependent DNA helicase PIF1
MSSKLETLTTEQLSVFHHLLHGRNIFLTGGGGVGKSYLLSAIYTHFPGMKKRLESSRSPALLHTLPRIQMCALTGCAALLLGHKAKTLHSWAGIGLGKGTLNELYIKIRRNSKAMRHWLCTDLLIIDEISMMTSELLDKLNELGKKIRANKKPFGGIQILLVGDFYQLPPVNKSNEQLQFAFESAAWNEVITCSVELTIHQRQKDEIFQKILKEARIGCLSKESCEIIRSREGHDWKENKIRPTLLFPRRAEVDMINDSNLRALTGRRYTYKAKLLYDGKVPNGFTENDENFIRILQQFDSESAYAKELELSIDAQVMLIANIDPDSGLVNGSRGIVVEFCPSTELPIVEFINGIRKTIGNHSWPLEDYDFVSRSQIPLRLAYAITTHKCQGSSVDSALVDIGSGNFEFGQAYVALSRARSLEALYVYDFNPISFKAHSKVKAFYNTLVVREIEEDDKKELIQLSQVVQCSNLKPILSESSKSVKAIHVVKEDYKEEPGAQIVSSEDNKEDNKEEPATQINWLFDSIPSTWKSHLTPCRDHLLELSQLLSTKSFLPKNEQIWTALSLTSLDTIKVVILGQDPYPTPGNAHGLAFSVLPDVKPIPASLKNIYKELISDIGFIPPQHGNLEHWARQGIMLLNTILTVEAGAPQSHSKIGWERITDHMIHMIAEHTQQTIFVLWGKSAQVKKNIIQSYSETNKHIIIESPHPSPLSASRGFFGSKPFSAINQLLIGMNKEPIQW